MKRGVTVEYVISVVAMLVAVWAVVQVGKKANVADLAATERYLKETRDHLIETRGMLIDTNDLVIDLKRQIAELREAQATVQAMLQEYVDPPPWFFGGGE